MTKLILLIDNPQVAESYLAKRNLFSFSLYVEKKVEVTILYIPQSQALESNHFPIAMKYVYLSIENPS